MRIILGQVRLLHDEGTWKAAITFGSISEFKESEDDWTSYTERLQQYFVANKVEAAERQRAILLSICGAPTYRLIRSLVAPRKPTELTFKDLVELVRSHHNPKPSTTVQRFKFNSRTQQPGETVAGFVAELRRLTEYCEYGDSLDDMLRDRLICGVHDARIQRRLLAEVGLTFQKAFQLAQSMELADRDAQDLHKTPTAEHSVQAVKLSLQPAVPEKTACILPVVQAVFEMWSQARGSLSFQGSGMPQVWEERPHCSRLSQQAQAVRSSRNRQVTQS